MPATKPTVYLETHSQDPAYNLAFEETVLKVRKDRPYLLLWQNDNTIVVGQNQNTAAEIDPDFVEAHHIHVAVSYTHLFLLQHPPRQLLLLQTAGAFASRLWPGRPRLSWVLRTLPLSWAAAPLAASPRRISWQPLRL